MTRHAAVPGGARRRIDRALFVRLHRWVGLVLAGFLLLAGATGALLVWYDELDAALSPALLRAPPPTPGARPLDPLLLLERAQAAYPHAVLKSARLSVEPGHALMLALSAPQDAGGGSAAELPDNQVFLDPYTGRVLGARYWGDLSQGLKNLMPFVYRLHYQLALGVVGSYAFGIVALLWTLDCFVGAYLTFPASRRSRHAAPGASRPWPVRWWPAWKVRWRGGGHKLNVDLHRAGGLWTWAMLFVLAWSGVAFNLQEVYQPAMKAVFAHQADVGALPARPMPGRAPALGWHAARETARRLMAAQAGAHGFTVLAEDRLMFDARTGTYRYDVNSSRDLTRRWGSTRLVFDADTGALKGLWLPTGAAGGDTVTTWLTNLHMAAWGGLPMRLLVCATGLVVAMLSVTGVVLWWKKRSGRRHAALRAGLP